MISIYLGNLAIESRVLIDGVDVSASVVAVEVHAHVHQEPTQVVITLRGPVELHGAPGVLKINPRPDAGDRE